jgi:hypothetical protein
MSDSLIQVISEARSNGALVSAVGGWYGAVAVEARTLATAELRSMIDLVHQGRLDRARDVMSLYRRANIAAFLPVRSESGAVHPGVLVEESTGGLLLLDGTHRALAALLASRVSIRATVIVPKVLRDAPEGDIRLGEVRVVEKEAEPKFAHRSVPDFRPAVEWVDQWRDALFVNPESEFNH